MVKAAKRLADDLRVVIMLTDLEVPPMRRRRGSLKLKVLYGFGDSSRGMVLVGAYISARRSDTNTACGLKLFVRSIQITRNHEIW
jgi:hypothetical protein